MLFVGRRCLSSRGLLGLLRGAPGEAAGGGGPPFGRPLRLLFLPQQSPLQRRQGASASSASSSSFLLLLGLPKRTDRAPGVRGLRGRGSTSSAPGAAPKDTSGSLENGHTNPGQENEKKPNKSQQLKTVFKEYGAVAVAFHVGISLMSLGMFYLAVSSGVDMTAILFKLGFDEDLVQSKLAAGTSTFLLAYAVHKLFAPVRISITLVSVPFLVRYFRKIGFFKPPAPNP